MSLRFCVCLLVLGLSACGGNAPPVQAPAPDSRAAQEPPATATPQQRAKAVEAAMLEQQSKVDATLDAADEPPAANDND